MLERILHFYHRFMSFVLLLFVFASGIYLPAGICCLPVVSSETPAWGRGSARNTGAIRAWTVFLGTCSQPRGNRAPCLTQNIVKDTPSSPERWPSG
jgi:hypothetical protein